MATVYNFGGEIPDRPIARARDHDGQWSGCTTDQWVAELISAVVDFNAKGVFLLGYGLSDIAIGRWLHEVVPPVREAVLRR